MGLGLVARIVLSPDREKGGESVEGRILKINLYVFNLDWYPKSINQVRAIAVRLTRPSDEYGKGPFLICICMFLPAPGVVGSQNQPS